MGRHPACRPPAQPAVFRARGSPSGMFYQVWGARVCSRLWQACSYVSQGDLGWGRGQVMHSRAQRLVFPESAQRSTRAAHRGSLWGARASGQGTEMVRPARRAGGRLPRKGLQKRVPSSDSRLEAPGQRSPLPQKWVRGASAGLRLKSRLLLRVKCKSELRSRKTQGASPRGAFLSLG